LDRNEKAFADGDAPKGYLKRYILGTIIQVCVAEIATRMEE